MNTYKMESSQIQNFYSYSSGLDLALHPFDFEDEASTSDCIHSSYQREEEGSGRHPKLLCGSFVHFDAFLHSSWDDRAINAVVGRFIVVGEIHI